MVNQQSLSSALERLAQRRAWSEGGLDALRVQLLEGRDRDLYRVNPYHFAARAGLEEREAIALFLHGVHAGLFGIDWNVVCPCCGLIVNSFRRLHQLHERFHCTACFRKERVSLDEYVQVTFTVSPDIRKIAYHQPDLLALKDFYFEHSFAKEGWYEMFGQIIPLPAFIENSTQYISEFPADGTLHADLGPISGLIIVVDLYNMCSVCYQVKGDEGAAAIVEKVSLDQEGFHTQTPRHEVGEVTIHGETYDLGMVSAVTGRSLSFDFESRLDRRSSIWIQYIPDTINMDEFVDLDFGPCLTAKRLFANQDFRKLFPSEAIDPQKGIAIKNMTFLFTDLTRSTEIYDKIGDLNAFTLIQQHFDRLYLAVAENHGAVVKTIGDAVMATFARPKDALAAARSMVASIDALNAERANSMLSLKLGIHTGEVIAVSMNNVLDYFGQTVNIAARVQGLAGSNELCFTQEVYGDDGVRGILETMSHEAAVIEDHRQLRGIEEKMRIYRLDMAS